MNNLFVISLLISVTKLYDFHRRNTAPTLYETIKHMALKNVWRWRRTRSDKGHHNIYGTTPLRPLRSATQLIKRENHRLWRHSGALWFIVCLYVYVRLFFAGKLGRV